MFSCRVCKEKDARISDLKEEIKSLRDVVMPTAHYTLEAREADSLLSGTQEIIQVTDKDLSKAEIERAERDALLSGNYA